MSRRSSLLSSPIRYDRLADGVQRVTGQPPMSVREFVSLHADKFGGRGTKQQMQKYEKPHETITHPIHRSPAVRHSRSRSMNTDTSPVTVRLLDDAGAFDSPIQVPKIVMSDDAWRAQLTDE